jgi:hypothetical protein
MRPFERKLHEEIEQLEPNQVSSHVGAAQAANSALKESEAALDGLRQNLARAIEAINADLAVAVRNLLPKVSVNLADGKVNIVYKSKSISMRPDLDRGKWSVESNEAGKIFSRQYLQYLRLTEEPEELAEAVGDYFIGNYKTLQDTSFGGPNLDAQPGPETMPMPPAGRPILQKGTQEPGTGYFA